MSNDDEKNREEMARYFGPWENDPVRVVLRMGVGKSCRTQTTRHLHILFNNAGKKLPHYVGEPSDHSYVNMPRHIYASAVYSAARKAGLGRFISGGMWFDIRFRS